jgi:hypothetical protein
VRFDSLHNTPYHKDAIMLQVLAGKNASPGKGMVHFQQQHPE